MAPPPAFGGMDSFRTDAGIVPPSPAFGGATYPRPTSNNNMDPFQTYGASMPPLPTFGGTGYPATSVSGGSEGQPTFALPVTGYTQHQSSRPPVLQDRSQRRVKGFG